MVPLNNLKFQHILNIVGLWACGKKSIQTPNSAVFSMHCVHFPHNSFNCYCSFWNPLAKGLNTSNMLSGQPILNSNSKSVCQGNAIIARIMTRDICVTGWKTAAFGVTRRWSGSTAAIQNAGDQKPQLHLRLWLVWIGALWLQSWKHSFSVKYYGKQAPC